MHPSISTSYIVPAIFLNPVLFLMSLNTILSRLLPPIVVDAANQPPPYSTYGPSAEHPHLDIHASEGLCWSYTLFMVCAQLVAFGRVSERREEGRARAERKKQLARLHCLCEEGVDVEPPNGHLSVTKGLLRPGDSHVIGDGSSSYSESILDTPQIGGSDDSCGTTDSEGIL